MAKRKKKVKFVSVESLMLAINKAVDAADLQSALILSRPLLATLKQSRKTAAVKKLIKRVSAFIESVETCSM